MIVPGLLARLACPRDRAPLREARARTLACEHGHEYPVVGGVPVLLVDDAQQTSGVAGQSLAAAARWAGAGADPPPDDLCLESLGASAAEKAQALRLADRGGFVDPVVSVLIAATNGLAYKTLVGALREYPIPDIRLAPAAGAALLDVGCGWGRWSISAARKGYRVVGIDPSLAAVMAARRVARQLGVDAEYLCADARYLPFVAGAFDVVFSYSVLQHFSKAAAATAIAEAARVLRSRGRCLAQMANASGVRSFYHRLRRGFAEGSGFDVRYWRLAELEAAFGREFSEVETSIHCFFGLGLEPSDRAIVPRHARFVIQASERLRALGATMPSLKHLADSVYVSATKQGL